MKSPSIFILLIRRSLRLAKIIPKYIRPTTLANINKTCSVFELALIDVITYTSHMIGPQFCMRSIIAVQ